MRRIQVVVIGASDDRQNCDEAQAVGTLIAQKGCVLISGGRGGVMEAASRGAAEAGGTVVGILPGNSFDEANEYCTIVIPTGIGFARNSMNVLSADIIIAIGGKSGTLSELAYAWHYGKPVIACTFSDGWSSRIISERIDSRRGAPLYPAASVQEVESHLEAFLNDIRKVP